MLKTTIVFCLVLVSIALVRCQKAPNPNTPSDFSAWQRSALSPRQNGNASLPTDFLVDCRKVGDVPNLHYYYNLIGDPTVKSTNLAGNGQQTFVYQNVDFQIEEVAIQPNRSSSQKSNLFQAPVDFKILQEKDGRRTAIATASADTLTAIQERYSRVAFFKDIKLGDTIFSVLGLGKTSSNETPISLPGIEPKQALECR